MIKVEKLKEEHLIEAYSLLKQLRPGLKLTEFKKVYQYMKDHYDFFEYVYIKDGDKIIGLASLFIRKNTLSPRGFVVIDDLVVDEAFQKRGLGRILVDYAKKYMKQRRADYIWLESGFHRKGAHQFYKKTNFSKHAFSFIKVK